MTKWNFNEYNLWLNNNCLVDENVTELDISSNKIKEIPIFCTSANRLDSVFLILKKTF